MTANVFVMPSFLAFRETQARIDFDLPPEKAVAFFKAKGLKPTFSYLDMLREQHDTAFTVAKMMDIDLLAKVRQEVDLAISEGRSMRHFRDKIKLDLQLAGWWGKKDVVDPLTGQVTKAQLGSAWRLNTIFRTNMQTAYAAGRWDQIVASAQTHKVLVYDAVDDHRVRPEHKQWDGTTLAVDDPFWDTHYPPNGYNCRCGVIQLTEEQLPLVGKTQLDRSPRIKRRKWTNPRTGKVHRIPADLDPGWDYHPGKSVQSHLDAVLAEKMGALPSDMAAAAQKALQAEQKKKLARESALKAKAAQLEAVKATGALALERSTAAALERAKQFQAQAQLEKIAAKEKGLSVPNEAMKKLNKAGELDGLTPVEQLAKIEAKADELQKIKTEKAKISLYKKQVIAGKTPSPANAAAFDSLPQAEKDKILAQIAAKKAAQEAKTAPAAPAAGIEGATLPDDLGVTPARSLDWDNMTQIGEQRGSNPGGFFQDTNTGEKFYIKFPASEDLARNELLAARLYELVGIEVPELQLIDSPRGVGIASKIVDGLEKAGRSGWDKIAGAHEGFVADAWLANWDVVGLSFDNLLVKAGRAVRADVGGSLRYRAQGGLKGAAWNSTVAELETLRNAATNPQSAAVFGNIAIDKLEDGARRIITLSDDQIRRVVDEFGPADAAVRKELADTLIARKADIRSRFPHLVEPPKTAPPPPDADARVTDQEVATIKVSRGNGYTLKADGPDIEDQAVHVWEEIDSNGERVTVAWLKVRGDAARALMEETRSASGPRSVVDLTTLDQKIITAIKGVASNKDAAVRPVDLERIKAVQDEWLVVSGKLLDAYEKGQIDKPKRSEIVSHYKGWIKALEDVAKVGEGGVNAWQPPTSELFSGIRAPLIKEAERAGREWTKSPSHFLKADIKNGNIVRTHQENQSFGYQLESVSDRARVRYWTDSPDQPFTLRNLVEVRVPGGAETAAARIMRELDDLGVNSKRATDLDREELYLTQIAYHNRKGWERIRSKVEGIEDQKARVDTLKQEVSAELGVTDVTKLSDYNPKGVYQAFENGRAQLYRPDLDDAKWRRFEDGYRLHHNLHTTNIADSIDRILNSGGQMAPTLDKLRRGIPPGGMSPSSDMQTGGASYFFTRIQTKAMAYGHPGLVWKARPLKRLDAISYNHDAFGRSETSFVLSNRQTGIEEWRAASRRGTNETIFKGSLSLFDDLDRIVARTPTERDTIIQKIKDHGFERWPDGRELTEVVTVAGR